MTRPEGPKKAVGTRGAWLCKGRGKPTLRKNENALVGTSGNGLAELSDLRVADLQLVRVLDIPLCARELEGKGGNARRRRTS